MYQHLSTEAVTALTALVLAPDAGKAYCALHRAASHVNRASEGWDAIVAAKHLGFDRDQAFGIINGWDSTKVGLAIRYGLGVNYQSESYLEAHALGADLFAKDKEAGLV